VDQDSVLADPGWLSRGDWSQACGSSRSGMERPFSALPSAPLLPDRAVVPMGDRSGVAQLQRSPRGVPGCSSVPDLGLHVVQRIRREAPWSQACDRLSVFGEQEPFWAEDNGRSKHTALLRRCPCSKAVTLRTVRVAGHRRGASHERSTVGAASGQWIGRWRS
jgi:hypothetical protein